MKTTKAQRALIEAAVALLNYGGDGAPHHGRLVATWTDEWQALRRAVLALPNVDEGGP